MNRREFFKLLAGAAIAAAAPVPLVPIEDKLEQVCWRIGQFSRELNWTNITRILAIDEYGRLALGAKVGYESESTFWLADRNLKYTKLSPRKIERQYLDRASETTCFVTANGRCHRVEMELRGECLFASARMP